MSVYLKLLSGDILTFSIFEGYKFSNLRSEFYDKMSEELSIAELECIIIFEDDDIVLLGDFVEEGKIYNVFINEAFVNIIYYKNSINFEHEFRLFPYEFNLKITHSIQDNYDSSYNIMYNQLINSFDEDINFFNDNPDDNFCQGNPFQTFKDYINNKYKKTTLSLEELITEYINTFISKRVKIKEIIYD
jgi:hypothetical protein